MEIANILKINRKSKAYKFLQQLSLKLSEKSAMFSAAGLGALIKVILNFIILILYRE